MPFSQCSETVEAGDAMPFSVHGPVAFLVAQHATFRQARARGGEAEVGNVGAALGGAGFGFLTDVAGEDDDVLHNKLLCFLSSGPSLRQDPEKARRMTRARWTAWTPETPRGPGWSGQAWHRPTRPGLTRGCAQETERD